MTVEMECEPARWILPSACLPQDDKKVLIVDVCGEVHLGCHRYDYWVVFGHNTYETHSIIAWLPIPSTEIVATAWARGT